MAKTYFQCPVRGWGWWEERYQEIIGLDVNRAGVLTEVKMAKAPNGVVYVLEVNQTNQAEPKPEGLWVTYIWRPTGRTFWNWETVDSTGAKVAYGDGFTQTQVEQYALRFYPNAVLVHTPPPKPPQANPHHDWLTWGFDLLRSWGVNPVKLSGIDRRRAIQDRIEQLTARAEKAEAVNTNLRERLDYIEGHNQFKQCREWHEWADGILGTSKSQTATEKRAQLDDRLNQLRAQVEKAETEVKRQVKQAEADYLTRLQYRSALDKADQRNREMVAENARLTQQNKELRTCLENAQNQAVELAEHARRLENELRPEHHRPGPRGVWW